MAYQDFKLSTRKYKGPHLREIDIKKYDMAMGKKISTSKRKEKKVPGKITTT